jgi:L-ascorbate metabolism protein UlaG (beta-lactamase superfamily)
MAITIEYLGHSGFLVRGSQHTVAIDPFLTGSPVATRTAEQIECSHIAITHGHSDHFGPDTLTIARKNNATVFGVFEICQHLIAQGHDKVEPCNTGGRVKTEFGFVAYTPAFHSSSLDGQYMGQPCGVVVSIDGMCIYHAGDTALFSDMQLIGDLYRPTVAILPIGDRYTMGPEHAARAAKMIGPRYAIPCHYNTWPPIAADPAAFAPEGVQVVALAPGQSTTL